MTASTVAQYLAALPADRRDAPSAVRQVINENLPEGYEEGMQFGMTGWYGRGCKIFASPAKTNR